MVHLPGRFLATQAPRDALPAGAPLVLAFAGAGGNRATAGGGGQAAAPGVGAATPGDGDAREARARGWG